MWKHFFINYSWKEKETDFMGIFYINQNSWPKETYFAKTTISTCSSIPDRFNMLNTLKTIKNVFKMPKNTFRATLEQLHSVTVKHCDCFTQRNNLWHRFMSFQMKNRSKRSSCHLVIKYSRVPPICRVTPQGSQAMMINFSSMLSSYVKLIVHCNDSTVSGTLFGPSIWSLLMSGDSWI